MREPFIYFLFFPLIQNFIIFRFSIFEKNGYNYSSLQKYIDWVINNIGIIIQQYLLYKYSIITHYNIAHYLSCILTLILFHSQHTFNPPYVVDNESWNLQDSSIKGSSFIEIPKYLKYFTMGIEYHYIHHYAIRIPGYNLQKYHEIFKISMQQEVIKLSIKDLFKNLALTLYDTENSKFVSFYEIENDNKLNKSNKSN
jgi:omega-6 fatty acid desaturase (delta-12 desaturase)